MAHAEAQHPQQDPTADEKETQHRQPGADNQGLIRLMESWIAEDAQGDAAAQEADWKDFKRDLNANRLSERPLFEEGADEEADIDEHEWLRAVATNPVFDFLKEPEEDIYMLQDGKPYHEQG